jgi:predicted TIM-barrel fold metal-dependent hydrolase
MGTYQVISADSHVVEPGDLWLKCSDPDFRERAPRIVRRDGTDYYEAEGGFRLFAVPTVANTGQPSRRRTGTFEETVPSGGYDLTARLADLAVDGVDAEVVYPTFAMRLYAYDDGAYRTASFRAYNRWIADFVAGAPDRLKGVGMVSLHDPAEAAAELLEIRRLGLVSAMVALSTDRDAGYDSTFYDPFWAVAEELGAPLVMHEITGGAESRLVIAYWDENQSLGGVIGAHEAQRTIATFVLSGVFERFPGLKVMSTENHTDWVPWFINRISRARGKSSFPTELSMRPIEYLRRNVYFTYINEPDAVQNRDVIGVDRLMWASDYPHSASTFPRSREIVERDTASIPADERRKLIHDNVLDLFGITAPVLV